MGIIKADTSLKYGDEAFYFNGDVDVDKFGKISRVYDHHQYYDIDCIDGTRLTKVSHYNVVSKDDGIAIIQEIGEYPKFEGVDEYLFASKQVIESAFKPTTANQYANTFSNYVYNHLDTAYKYDKTVGNIFDIYMVTETEPQIDIKINVTTYADKVRVNVFYTGTRNLIVSVILQPKRFTPEASEDNLNYIIDRIYSKLRKLGKIK
jgi:hypothetical protein